ncbi:hypothetical protein BGZ49_001408 [Haplosporangium sp. Z 27]|nr:hypothetical protein BGZ49_001408 [Haplosporangium sp. Z 27]
MAHVLHILEVQNQIGWYLDKVDVIPCSQVCRSWYIAFAPLIWESLDLTTGTLDPPKYSKKFRHSSSRTPQSNFYCQRSRILPAKHNVHQLEELFALLRERGQWLRTVNFLEHLSPSQFFLGKECTHLRELSIGRPLPFDDVYTRTYWKSCKKLIKQNKATLRSLHIQGFEYDVRNKPQPNHPLWIPILSCTGHYNLKTLIISNCHIRGRHLKAFWSICERLERLELIEVKFDMSHPAKGARAIDGNALSDSALQSTEEIPLSKDRFPRLLELYLKNIDYGSTKRQLNLIIAECPRLKTLHWKHYWVDWPDDLFCDLLAARTWPDLESLNLRLSFKYDVQFSCERVLKEARNPFKKFALNTFHFETSAYNLLKTHHGKTIREIDLSKLRHSVSWAHDLLASCPTLESIKASMLKVQDILVDNRPWVCTGLRHFQMPISTEFRCYASSLHYTEEQLASIRTIYRHLSDLTKLESLLLLNTSKYYCSKSYSFPIQIGLGLELLSGLRLLETFSFPGIQEMSRKDILWIVQHWKSLKQFTGGPMNRKRDLSVSKGKFPWDFELSKILNEHGVNTPGSKYSIYYLDEEKKIMGGDWPKFDDEKEEAVEEEEDTTFSGNFEPLF